MGFRVAFWVDLEKLKNFCVLTLVRFVLLHSVFHGCY